MEFNVNVCTCIPCMAWAIIMTKNEDKIELYVGNNVEVFDNCFVEGVWDGEFRKMDFDNAELLCGSAGKILKNKLTLYTACHPLERIVLHQNNNKLFASNSVPFLLEISKNKLDIQYINYESDFCSIKNGLQDYCRHLPLADNKTFSIYYYCNIEIDKELNVLVKNKKSTTPVTNFEDYYYGLLSVLEKIKNNSEADERINKFGIVTTVSKGYDSACCAALAKKIGCNVALTFNEPEKYSDDNGDVVAEQLGYTDIRYANANHYYNNKDLVESYHTSTGELGTTICFEAFTDDFKGNIVFYGDRGDSFWSKTPKNPPNSNFAFPKSYNPGIGFAEWRLKVGFIQLPIAFYKGTHWENLNTISNSKEMANWSIGGDYDRPIPRRICEDMGVSRKEFGQAKKGAGFNYNKDNLSRIRSRMSPNSFQEFYKFYNENKRKFNLYAQMHYIWKMLPDYLNFIFYKLHIKIWIEKKEWNISNPGAPSYLIHWGIKECMKQYKI